MKVLIATKQLTTTGFRVLKKKKPIDFST